MRRSLVSLACGGILGLAVAAGGCSSGSSSPSNQKAKDPSVTATVAPKELVPITVDGLTTKLQEIGGLDQRYAACTARRLFGFLTEDEKRQLNQPNPPDAVTNKVMDEASDAGAGC